jgi:hypothetical protein
VKKIYLFLLLLTVSFSLAAQTVVVYDAFDASTTIKPENAKRDKNFVQWDIFALGRGAFVLDYERKINNYLGIQVAAGPTFLDLSLDGLDQLFESDVNYKAGLYVGGALKIYPKEMFDFEGVYVSPTVRYRTYKRQYSGETDFLTKKVTDFALIVGYQYESWSYVTWNWFAGFGWSLKNSVDRIEEWDNNSNSYSVSYEPVKKNGPLFIIGTSLGFTF